MRKETRQEVVQVRDVEVYIADDGTEFKKRRDCEQYEWDNIKKPLLEKLQKCKDAFGVPNCDGGYVSDCYDYEWYYIRSQEDIDILNKVYDTGLTDKCIGEWVCVEIDDCGEAWVTTASDGIKYATDLLTKLGYKVEITKEDWL